MQLQLLQELMAKFVLFHKWKNQTVSNLKSVSHWITKDSSTKKSYEMYLKSIQAS
jgi:hypothetical protein